MKSPFLYCAISLTLSLGALSAVYAGSATWLLSPTSGDWNTAANWTPATVPNGPSDFATFDSSSITAVSISTDVEVNAITFDPGASAFTITPTAGLTLTISGGGVTNNSGITQNFVGAADGAGNFGVIQFTNSASAGSSISFTNNGGLLSGAVGGNTNLLDSSTTENSTFNNRSGTVTGANGGEVQFFGTATADHGNFTSNGSTVSGANGGVTTFSDTSTAANGIFTANGAGHTGATGGITQF